MEGNNINDLEDSKPLSTDINAPADLEISDFFELVKPILLKSDNLNNELFEASSNLPLILGLLGFSGILIPLVGYIICTTGIIISSKYIKQINNKYASIGLILSIISLLLSIIRHFVNIFIMAKSL